MDAFHTTVAPNVVQWLYQGMQGVLTQDVSVTEFLDKMDKETEFAKSQGQVWSREPGSRTLGTLQRSADLRRPWPVAEGQPTIDCAVAVLGVGQSHHATRFREQERKAIPIDQVRLHLSCSSRQPCFILAFGFITPLLRTPIKPLSAPTPRSRDYFFVGLQNFNDLFRDDLFLKSLAHNIVWVLLSIAIPVVLGLVLAVLLSGRRRSRLFYAGVSSSLRRLLRSSRRLSGAGSTIRTSARSIRRWWRWASALRPLWLADEFTGACLHEYGRQLDVRGFLRAYVDDRPAEHQPADCTRQPRWTEPMLCRNSGISPSRCCAEPLCSSSCTPSSGR